MKRILLWLLGAIALFLLWQWISFPDVARLAKEPPGTTAFMERRKAELRRRGLDDTLEYKWVPYRKISSNLRKAVLVAEDSSFYDHAGIDVRGLREALRRDLESGRITHGGSTITQQLAKNLYLSPSRNPYRKVKELIITKSLEEHLEKKRILEIYLNVVEFGERTYGAEAAARRYFNKSAAALSPSEAALLAGCLPNPRIMDPASPNKRLRKRQRMILSRMRRWGHLVETGVAEKAAPPATVTAAPLAPPPDTLPTAAPTADASPPVETTTVAPTGEPIAEEAPEVQETSTGMDAPGP